MNNTNEKVGPPERGIGRRVLGIVAQVLVPDIIFDLAQAVRGGKAEVSTPRLLANSTQLLGFIPIVDLVFTGHTSAPSLEVGVLTYGLGKLVSRMVSRIPNPGPKP